MVYPVPCCPVNPKCHVKENPDRKIKRTELAPSTEVLQRI